MGIAKPLRVVGVEAVVDAYVHADTSRESAGCRQLMVAEKRYTQSD
jgi:hypothetical protein